MLSVILATVGSLVREVSSVITKFEIGEHKESIFTASFINTIFAAGAFFLLGLIRGNLVFSLDSWPTFLPRVFLEILQGHVAVLALSRATRSTSVFFANLTIPLILIADLVLGFSISANQWIGILIILAALGMTLVFHIINRQGIGYAIAGAIIPVFTIQLFKYDISNFNSVEAEQALVLVLMALYFWAMARIWTKERPLRFLRHRIFLAQGISDGLASILISFAVFFGNPGIATTAKRAATVLAGIISGHNYFQEKKYGAKFIVAGVLIGGLVLLGIG